LEGKEIAEIPTPTVTSGTKSRPLGITILAILMILGGLLNLFGIAGSYGLLDMAWSGIAGVIGLILGYSMWQLIPWARQAALIWYIISMIMTLVIWFVIVMPIMVLLLGPMAFSVGLIAIMPSLVISLIIIIYLNSGGVKAAFEGVGGW
jgi:hypothetical protein